MKTRPTRPGITAAKAMYEELDRSRETLDYIGGVIGEAYRMRYKISDAAALPSLQKCIFKFIADSNYIEANLNNKLADTLWMVKSLGRLVWVFAAVAFGEAIWIWLLLLGGHK